jgi:hypothetical protein
MKIFTYIPIFSTGDIHTNEIKSFKTYEEAYYHARMVLFPIYEIIENELN